MALGDPIRAIAKAMAAKLDALSIVERAFDHQPAKLPPRGLAVMSVLFTGFEQTDAFTGPATDNAWVYRVNCYLRLGDYLQAQQKLAELLPEILAIVRDDPTLAGTCEWARLDDTGLEPVFNHDEGYLLKSLRLTAYTEES